METVTQLLSNNFHILHSEKFLGQAILEVRFVD
jgi:hypothetical protein